MARFEWDEAKRQLNLEKHGIDFRRAQDLFDGRPLRTIPSPFEFEVRFLTTGDLDGRLVTMIWTPRSGGIRIISVRKARYAERRQYRELYG